LSYIFVALSQQITSTKRTVKYSVFDFTQNTFPGASTQTPFEIICTISVMQCYKDDTCKSLEPPTGKHQTSNITTSLSHWNGKITLLNLNLLASHIYSVLLNRPANHSFVSILTVPTNISFFRLSS